MTRALGLVATYTTRRQLRQFEGQLENCKDVQNRRLFDILRVHQESGFGKQHRFERIKSYKDFAKAVPVANYNYFLPWIDLCLRGETQALLGPAEKLLMFAMTSGTTARAKHIPVTQRFVEHYRRGWNIWGIRALSDHPGGMFRKILQVISPAEEYRSEGGVPCGAISGMLAETQKSIVRKLYATPGVVGEIPDASSRYYTIMRLAMAQDIGFISTANPSTSLTLARTAQKHALHLIRDIHDGTLLDTLSIPVAIRRELEPCLKKNAARAKELDSLLNKHGNLLPQHYWNLAFVGNWTGGTVGMYLPYMAEYYGNVPIRDIGLLASEGRMSIPMEDGTPSGVLDIGANFYEFVRQEEMDSLDDPASQETLSGNVSVLLASELEIGKRYYILLTNTAGLYRYNIGDIIGVTDYVGTTPVIEFLSKGAHTSSITGEKLTENQAVRAVRAVADQLAIRVENFVLTPQWDDPPYYKLYFETKDALPGGLLRQFGETVDRRLCLANIEYDSKRESMRLGCIQARQLPTEVLLRRDRELMKNNHGRAEQFKHRFLCNEPLDVGNPK